MSVCAHTDQILRSNHETKLSQSPRRSFFSRGHSLSKEICNEKDLGERMVIRIKVIDENKLLKYEYNKLKEEYNKLLNQKADEIINDYEFRSFIKESLKDLVRDMIVMSIDDIVYEISNELSERLSDVLNEREINMIVDRINRELPRKLLDEFKKINMIEALKQIIYDAL